MPLHCADTMPYGRKMASSHHVARQRDRLHCHTHVHQHLKNRNPSLLRYYTFICMLLTHDLVKRQAELSQQCAPTFWTSQSLPPLGAIGCHCMATTISQNFLVTPFTPTSWPANDTGTKRLQTKHLQTKCLRTIRLQDKMSTGQNIYRTKRLQDKTSMGPKVYLDKTSKGQNVSETKRLMGKNI